MSNDRKEENHPAYGMIGLHRQTWSGKSRLFGSPLSKHHMIIALTIKRAYRTHDLSMDRIFGREELIEVLLSPHQFSELITTMNVGDGVPCTIRHIDGQLAGEIPDTETEAERIESGFADRISALRSKVAAVVNKIATEMSSSVPKTKKREWEIALSQITSEVESHWPFIVSQFHEATERAVEAKKAEIDAFVTRVVHQTGLEQLRAISSKDVNIRSLPKTDEETK